MSAQIQMHAVQSSAMQAIGYDEETKTLRIRYNDSTNKQTGEVTPGKLYDYSPVSPEFYKELNEAESKGKMLGIIRKLSCQQVEEGEAIAS